MLQYAYLLRGHRKRANYMLFSEYDKKDHSEVVHHNHTHYPHCAEDSIAVDDGQRKCELQYVDGSEDNFYTSVIPPQG